GPADGPAPRALRHHPRQPRPPRMALPVGRGLPRHPRAALGGPLQPQRHLRVHVAGELSSPAGADRRGGQARRPARLPEPARPAQPAGVDGEPAAAAARAGGPAPPAGQGVLLQPLRRRGGPRMMSPWLGILLVPSVLGAMLGGLRLYQKWGSPHPELLRKILHVGMGLLAVAFPWIFDRSWPVLVLGVFSLGVMIALRTMKRFSEVGSVLSGVRRVSLGEIYFPVAIIIQWHLYLFERDPDATVRVLLYCIPLLLLTLADAVAALVGVHYGKWRYVTEDGRKSAEG